jgi:hypothetical protein
MAHKGDDKVRRKLYRQAGMTDGDVLGDSRGVLQSIQNFTGVGDEFNAFGFAISPVFQIDSPVIEVAKIQVAALRLGNRGREGHMNAGLLCMSGGIV